MCWGGEWAASRLRRSCSASPTSWCCPTWWGSGSRASCPAQATATDLVLRLTQLLRAVGVVGRFVEYFGPGLAALTVADRATIANMAPEYGATCGYFPVDEQTLRYLALTGRSTPTSPGWASTAACRACSARRAPRPGLQPGGGVRPGRRAAESRRPSAPPGPDPPERRQAGSALAPGHGPGERPRGHDRLLGGGVPDRRAARLSGTLRG